MTRSLSQLISLGLTAGVLTMISGPAQANKLDAVTQRLGNACKLRVVEHSM